MTKILKEDIKILDFIIDEICKTGVYSVTEKYLADKKVFGFGEIITAFDIAFIERDLKEFERIAGIIEEFNCVTVLRNTGAGNPLSINKNTKTLQFQKLGGFRNVYKEQNKKKIYNEPWIGYLIAFITLLFAFYQGFQNHSLEKDISSSKLSIDSLRNEALSHKKKLDSLNVRYVLFESKLSDLKNNTEKKK